MSSIVPKGKPAVPFHKVYIIHENDDWTEALRYCCFLNRKQPQNTTCSLTFFFVYLATLTRRMALDAQDVPYEVWHLGQGGHFDMSEIPPEGIFYNRMSPSSHSRDHRYGPEYTHAVLEWLELHNRKVVNVCHRQFVNSFFLF